MDLEGSRPLQGKLAIAAGLDAKVHPKKCQLRVLVVASPDSCDLQAHGPRGVQSSSPSTVDDFTTTPEIKFKPHNSAWNEDFKRSDVELLAVLGNF